MTRALVVDSNAERAKNTEFYLQQDGYKTAITKPGKSCKQSCVAQLPEIILLTVDSWQDQSVNTLIELKSATKTKSIPVLVLTTCSDPKTLIYALDMGAHECVQANLDQSILAAKIRSVLAFSSHLKKLQLANLELMQLASTDALTHVYNRRHFFTLSQTEYARAKRYNRELAVIMLDIDDFKIVNDRYGHAAGDMALVSLAECCINTIRESDIVGRLGGEEFAICCPETDLMGARVLAERIRQRCEATLLQFQDQSFCITISLGVTTINPEDASLEAAMQRSDKLLYSAKKRGRNCSVAS